jgi:tRNA-dihydrouridine synthase
VTEFRKHYAGYLRGVPGVARLRMELMAFVTLRDVEDHLNRFLEHGTSETAALEPHPAGITS